MEVCPFGLESKLEMFGFKRSVFVRRGVGEWIISACVFPTVKYGGVMVCCAGDTVSDLFRIQGTLNQHGYHSIDTPGVLKLLTCSVYSMYKLKVEA